MKEIKNNFITQTILIFNRNIKLICSILLIISIILFLTSNTIHILTYNGINFEEKHPWIWILHFILLALCFLGSFIYSKSGSENTSDGFYQMKYAPEIIKDLIALYLIYEIIIFIFFIVINPVGGPEIKNGKYYLFNHGSIIREINEQEYTKRKVACFRAFSGAWMLFSLVSLGIFASGLNDPKLKSSDLINRRKCEC
jgi:hypothetical protein